MNDKHTDVAQSTPGQWASRIVGHDRVDPSTLVANPLNFRIHPNAQREALAAALTEVGFVRSVTVNRTTGNLVDGHERVWQALKTEQAEIDVEYVELTQEEEHKVLATLDHIGGMAVIDDQLLGLLLSDVEAQDADFQKMLDGMAEDLDIPADPDAPMDFPAYDEGIETEHTCPKCGYEWSGKAR